MPAPDANAPVPPSLVKALVQQLIKCFANGIGDDCIIWLGGFTDRDRRNPVANARRIGLSKTSISVRQFIASDPDVSRPVVMTCATKGCVNPRHMRRASTARPREIGQGFKRRIGGNSFAAKTDEDARASILSALASGEMQQDIAARFGVSQSTISRIKRSK